MTDPQLKTVLLISGKVLHYRVSVYNYLWRRFREDGWDYKVLADCLQSNNTRPVRFDLQEVAFGFRRYRQVVREIKPDVVILFVHLKEFVLWPLIHWLKWRRIPVVVWTKGANLDEPESRLRYQLFNYVHTLADAIILYSANEVERLKSRNRVKAVAANNTINFEEIPAVAESKDEIKKEFGLPFKKLVLFVGTMGLGGERKKVEHLIEIFREIEREDVGVAIVGSGMPEALKQRINPRNTRYLGTIHDPEDRLVSKLFKAADLFVVPGHIGLGLNQAFYWGLPVVTEGGNQPPEIRLLKSGRNGFMVLEGDVAALKEKVLYLLDNDEVRSRFSEMASEDLHREASIEGMYQAFLTAVKTAHAGRRAVQSP